MTDAWVGNGLRRSQPHHPLGLPPHFVTNGPELGLELDADPGLDAVLAARRDRQDIVSAALVSESDLSCAYAGRLSGFSRLGAFQVVVAEEWPHLGFVRRDLGVLRSR